jgi:cysteine synthase A
MSVHYPISESMKTNKNILGLIGNTPIVQINRVVPPDCAEIWAKLEGFNPGGSVKDRIALAMIEKAEREGKLRPGGTVIEPTSGNTGIGLSLVTSVKGYRLILVMPETMSLERRQIFQAFGVELILSPGSKGMLGAVEEAEIQLKKNPEYFMPMQFENTANPAVHRETTAVEIIDAIGTGIDAFVAGVGTGGTITGVGEVIKSGNPDTLVVAVEPAGSAVLSGGEPGPHKIAGLGAGFYPGVLNMDIYNEIIRVSDEDATETARRLAREEGIFAGISSGAAAWAAQKVASKLGEGKKVVVVFPDRGERYLSTGLFSPPSL